MGGSPHQGEQHVEGWWEEEQVGKEKTSLQLRLTCTNFLIMFKRHLSKCDEIMCSDLLHSWMNS